MEKYEFRTRNEEAIRFFEIAKKKKNLIKFNHISGYVFTRVNGVY